MFYHVFLFLFFIMCFCVCGSDLVSVCFKAHFCVCVFMPVFQNMFQSLCFRSSFRFVFLSVDGPVSDPISVFMLQKILTVCECPKELTRLLEKFVPLLVSGEDPSSQNQAAGAPTVKTLFLNVARVINNLAMDIKSQEQLEVWWLFLNMAQATKQQTYLLIHCNHGFQPPDM